jgi:CRISPR-associated protein Cas2
MVRGAGPFRLCASALMADQRNLHLVTYDIRDSIRWRRAYRILRGYGRRLQYSVFRVNGTAVQVARLRWELERVLDPVDALLVLRLCPSCAEHACAINEDVQWPIDTKPFKVVG